MKKEKLKAIEKSKKKALRGSLEQDLAEKIKAAVKELGYKPKKLKDEIEEASKLLAKRIAQDIDIKKQELLEIVKAKAGTKEAKNEFEDVPKDVFGSGPKEEDQDTSRSNGAEEPAQLSGKRIVRENTRNTNVDLIALADSVAKEKTKAGEPDLDEQFGSVS